MTPSQSSLDTAEHTERNEAFEGADGGAPLVAILADEVSSVRVHTYMFIRTMCCTVHENCRSMSMMICICV